MLHCFPEHLLNLGALLGFPERLLAKVRIVSVGDGACRSNGVIESHTLKDTDSP
jgi:hypothetical protein